MLSLSVNSRYPTEGMPEYLQKTGRLLPHRIGQILEQLGFKTWINPKQNNGVDIKVWDNEQLVLVGEILNWSPYTRLSENRVQHITDNLLDAAYDNCERVLIYTAMENEYALEDLEMMGITTLRIGNQILPRLFYNHYLARNQVKGRIIDSRTSTTLLKNRLTEHMQTLLQV